MCGICGLLQLPGQQPVSGELLNRMRDLIQHRGPDDAGSYLSPDGRIGLANRRLAIIDLSSSGRQPLSNEDGTIWIAYNGETYNFVELRSELQARGHNFRSETDTEVVVHLYEQYGVECVQHMRGMFALAIWDENVRRLFLARDRLGVKPLYYAFAPDAFLFASEIKCLLAHSSLARSVDNEAFYHFLTFLTTPAPQTLFKGIMKLPPGHRAVVNAEGEIRVEEYWDVFTSAQPASTYSFAENAERVQAGLRDSVRLRMVSDVPFGVLLSGGVDSSINVALMAAQMDQPVQTFSIGYKGAAVDEFNEVHYARQVADRFGTDHHEILIGRDDLANFLPDLIYHQDEPIADPVCVPVYYVCRLAKQSGTTVVQVGEGADELFGGYRHWLAALRLRRFAWPAFSALPGWARTLSLRAATPLLDELRLEYLRRGAAGEELFWGGAIAFGEGSKRSLLTDSFLRSVRGLSSHQPVQQHRRRFDERCPQPDYLSWMSYLDLHMRLPELLLMRVDKMSMATSVEARVPFLDHEFVELVMGMPQRHKLPHLRPKQLLKHAVREIIPANIINRQKQGFRVPVRQWLAESLGRLAERKLHDFCERTDYMRWPEVSKLVYAQDEMVWYLLNFVLWHELWIEGVPSNDLISPDSIQA
ncbi:MAG: asparagine synthase (glutamine-hydrolyzing) [Anaerolineales bacterium]|nr:asparagine synthase (glutamine-hydrolyzing) [Anaerolineales bacterium]